MGNSIQQDGLLRLPQIIGNLKADPPIPPIIPISASSWWAGVKSGKYPKPIKLGPKTTAWKASQVLALVNGAGMSALDIGQYPTLGFDKMSALVAPQPDAVTGGVR